MPRGPGLQPSGPRRQVRYFQGVIPRSIANDHAGGVFYLYGDDHYRKRACASFLIERYADPATRDFNLDRLSGPDVTVEQLASIISTPPMMSEWRVVHLQEAEALAGSKHARDVLQKTAKKPPPQLVLIVEATVPQRSRARFYTQMARSAKPAEFKALERDAVPAWLVRWAERDAGIRLEIDAAQALAAAVGNDLGMLTLEVRKLAEMVGEGAPVDRDAVRRSGLQVPEQDRWQWFDMVGRRRFADALAGLPVLVEQGETAVGLVMGLATQFFRIGLVVEGVPRRCGRRCPPTRPFWPSPA